MSSDITTKSPSSTNIIWHQATVNRVRHEAQNGHLGAIIWFTGLSGSGKSTLAYAVEKILHQHGSQTIVLDGDNIRHGLCGDLGFSVKDRQENIRRIGEVAKLLMEAGLIVLTAFISPYRIDREKVREKAKNGDFIEIYCDASIEICKKRDTKGLYKKAFSGEILEFTGVSSPYQVPEKPDLTLNTGTVSLDKCIQLIIEEIRKRGICTLQLDPTLETKNKDGK